jgi:hypothetical protein
LRKPNVFAGPYLDRAAHLRKDEAFVAAALLDPSARFVPIWKTNTLLRRRGGEWSAELLEPSALPRERWPDASPVAPGHFRGQICFAIECARRRTAGARRGARFRDRVSRGELPPMKRVCWPMPARWCCGASGIAIAAPAAAPTGRPAQATS